MKHEVRRASDGGQPQMKTIRVDDFAAVNKLGMFIWPQDTADSSRPFE